MQELRSSLFMMLGLLAWHAGPAQGDEAPSAERRDAIPDNCFYSDGRIVCDDDRRWPQRNRLMYNSDSSRQGFGGAIDLGSGTGQAPESGMGPMPAPTAVAPNAAMPASRADDAPGRATRIFAGPNQFPPDEFAAYAIVVFKSKVVAEDRLRRINACLGYTAAILTPSDVDVPRSQQLVTVWPLDDDTMSAPLDDLDSPEACALAVENYGLAMALEALEHVRQSRLVSPEDWARIKEGRGPFIFAWNPGEAKGQDDALILRVDMSDVATTTRFREFFEAWRWDVEARQDLWIDGWREDDVWSTIGTWADRWGGKIMVAMGWGPGE